MFRRARDLDPIAGFVHRNQPMRSRGKLKMVARDRRRSRRQLADRQQSHRKAAVALAAASAAPVLSLPHRRFNLSASPSRGRT